MMKIRFWCAAGAALFVSACGDMQNTSAAGDNGFISPLPESILNMAAQGQNLNAVRIDPADGCYVYQHSNPVETTFLPLRTTEGRPICTQAA